MASERLNGVTSTSSLFEHNSSLVREEARPSPERLDAQLRQLTGELGRTTSTLARCTTTTTTTTSTLPRCSTTTTTTIMTTHLLRTLERVESRGSEGKVEVDALVEQGKEVVACSKALMAFSWLIGPQPQPKINCKGPFMPIYTYLTVKNAKN